MNKANIISAGKMMAIVVMLFGVLYCVAAFVPSIHESFGELSPEIYKALSLCLLIVGGLFFISGVLLEVMFSKAYRNPAVGMPVLILGTLVAVCGIVSLAFIYRNPVSWMTAILGIAIFIDALCLKIVLTKTVK